MDTGLARLRVAVVGAGYAGIAAAVALVRGGASVAVLEANRTPGGRARRVDYRGTRLDNGQHLLLGAYRETLALLATVGAPAGALRRLPLALHYPGVLSFAAPRLPAPLHLAAALVAARGLGLADRYAAVRFAGALRGGEAAARPGETVAALLLRLRQTPRLRELLWEPLCVAALNTPADAADAAVFARVMHDALLGSREDSDLLIPADDLSALLPDPAIAWLRGHGALVALGARVSALAPTEGGWRVAAGALDERFDAVIVATAPAEAAALLEPLPGLAPLAHALGAIEHEPITTLYLQYPGPLALPFPMQGVAAGCAQWIFDRAALGGPAGLVAAVISASREQAALGHEALAALVHREVERLAGPLPAPSWTKVITEKRATFACRPGAFRPPVATPAAGLLLAGDYTAGPYPATLEAAVRSGAEAARTLLSRRETP